MEEEGEPGDPHLRSAAEVCTYQVAARDGEVGRVSDLIMHEETWALRFAVVRTRKWLLPREFLISPGWVDSVVWEDRHVHLKMRRDEVEASPVFNAAEPVNHGFEERQFDYYGRPRPRSP